MKRNNIPSILPPPRKTPSLTLRIGGLVGLLSLFIGASTVCADPVNFLWDGSAGWESHWGDAHWFDADNTSDTQKYTPGTDPSNTYYMNSGIIVTREGTNTGTGLFTMAGGTLMNYTASDTVFANPINVVGTDVRFKAGWSRSLTFTGEITATGNINIECDSGTVHFQDNTVSLTTANISIQDYGTPGLSAGGDPSYGGVGLKGTVTTNIASGRTLDWKNAISGDGSLKVTGSGILHMHGEANTYTGGTRIESGTLRVKASAGLGTGTITLAGGTLQNYNNGSNPVFTNDVVIESGINGKFMAGWTDASLTLAGNITLDGNLEIVRDSSWVKFQNNTISAHNNNVTIRDNGNAREQDHGGIELVGNVTVDTNKQIKWQNAISGDGSLTIKGSGYVQLENANNTYTGGTRIEGGYLRVWESGGAGTGPITLAGGTLQNQDSTPVLANQIVIEAGKTGKFMAGWNKSLTIAGDITANGNIEIAADSGTVYFKGNTITATENIGINNGKGVALQDTVTIDVANGKSVDWNNVIAGDGILRKTGDGILEVKNATNSYTGGTRIEGGTLRAHQDTALGTGTITLAGGILQNRDRDVTLGNDIIIEAGKTGKFMAGWNKSLTLTGDITANGDIEVVDDSGTVCFNGNRLSATDNITIKGVDGIVLSGTVPFTTDVAENKTLTWESTISGEGSITKTGEGMMILAGTNSFSGGVNVEKGTLQVTNSGASGTGTIKVDTDGNLLLSEDVTTAGDLELSGTWIEVIRAVDDYANLTLQRALFTEDTVLKLDVAEGCIPEEDATFTILTATDGITAPTSNFVWSNMLSEEFRDDWSVWVEGNSLILGAYQPGGEGSGVPEPATWVLLMCGVGGLAGARSWKKRA